MMIAKRPLLSTSVSSYSIVLFVEIKRVMSLISYYASDTHIEPLQKYLEMVRPHTFLRPLTAKIGYLLRMNQHGNKQYRKNTVRLGFIQSSERLHSIGSTKIMPEW